MRGKKHVTLNESEWSGWISMGVLGSDKLDVHMQLQDCSSRISATRALFALRLPLERSDCHVHNGRERSHPIATGVRCRKHWLPHCCCWSHQVCSHPARRTPVTTENA